MMKHGLILITFLMGMTACSSVDVSPGKVEQTNELLPQTIALEQTKYITENEMIDSNQDMKLVNSENINSVETQSSLLNSTQTLEDNTYFSQESLESLVDEKEETPAEDSIIIGDTEYIKISHEEKFQDWLTVAEKYGAALYAIPYSDVFAIVKDEEVLVGMSTGVASAAPNHIDILCDLMADKGEYSSEIIEGIQHVAQTGDSVQVNGPQEFGDDFAINQQDEWIVVSW
ncbi:hypothetical protein P9D43_00730 [Neobacillus niacini]|uniref:hypothetical protein n=1 Tax=Neobacillus niacini TaxID=86668 RepID=UPI0007ABCDD7|nr:hypothetical protein [Neobacillus niacini]MEC1520553.1 hypothetical protein [Neobacillus niacini]